MSEVELIEPIEIELDKKRQLKITLAGMIQAERKLKQLRGDPMLSLWLLPMEELNAGGFSVETTMALLWAGLVHQDKDLTFDEMLELPSDPKEIVAKVRDAFMRFYKLKNPNEADVVGETETDDKKKPSQPGLNSGHSPALNSD